MEKKWDCLRVRMTEGMAAEVRNLAELENRPIMHEVRHLIEVGLSHKRAGSVQGIHVANCVHVGTESHGTAWNGTERRRG